MALELYRLLKNGAENLGDGEYFGAKGQVVICMEYGYRLLNPRNDQCKNSFFLRTEILEKL